MLLPPPLFTSPVLGGGSCPRLSPPRCFCSPTAGGAGIRGVAGGVAASGVLAAGAGVTADGFTGGFLPSAPLTAPWPVVAAAPFLL